MTVYFPSPDLLFKMMRACVGCLSVRDLWIYNETINQVIESDLSDENSEKDGPQESN